MVCTLYPYPSIDDHYNYRVVPYCLIGHKYMTKGINWGPSLPLSIPHPSTKNLSHKLVCRLLEVSLLLLHSRWPPILSFSCSQSLNLPIPTKTSKRKTTFPVQSPNNRHWGDFLPLFFSLFLGLGFLKQNEEKHENMRKHVCQRTLTYASRKEWMVKCGGSDNEIKYIVWSLHQGFPKLQM